jgi:hypothetical protein
MVIVMGHQKLTVGRATQLLITARKYICKELLHNSAYPVRERIEALLLFFD